MLDPLTREWDTFSFFLGCGQGACFLLLFSLSSICVALAFSCCCCCCALLVVLLLRTRFFFVIDLFISLFPAETKKILVTLCGLAPAIFLFFFWIGHPSSVYFYFFLFILFLSNHHPHPHHQSQFASAFSPNLGPITHWFLVSVLSYILLTSCTKPTNLPTSTQTTTLFLIGI